MFDKLRIRSKLVAIVAAPLVVLLVVAALGAAQRRDEAADAREDAARLRVVEQAQAAGQAVQLEALLTVAATKGIGDDPAVRVARRRQQTDQAAAAFEAATDELTNLDAAVGGILEGANNQLNFIDDLRNQVDGGGEGFELARQYSLVTESLQAVVDGLRESVGDPTLSSGVADLAALDGYKTATATQATYILSILGEGSLADPGGETGRQATAENVRADVAELGEAADTAEAVYLTNATAEGRTELRNRLSGPERDLLDSASEEIDSVAFGGPLTTEPGQYLLAANSVLGELRGISQGIATDLVDEATASADGAAQAARLYLAGAGIALLVALGLAAAVAASITRPLTRLTHAVDRVSEDQLPRLVEGLRHPERGDIEYLASSVRPIKVSGGRELTHLGDSVNTIQQVALEVATEQATLLRRGIGEMFVNLARRNQALLDRQIEYIDTLEAEEQNPTQLESLFKLDHMATRMRRNAESLLVLAGAEPTRKRGRPVPVADVVRAAVGEVQDYQRIKLLSFDTAQIGSSAALDVAHLASELMENATAFSPPDTEVEVVGHHKATGYVVSISDHGIGMPAEQLAEANELLANPPLVGLTLSKSLGFIVVGRLASRFSIGARLIPSPTGGITAVVHLPASVLTESSPSDEEMVAAREQEASGEPLASVIPIGPGEAEPAPGDEAGEPRNEPGHTLPTGPDAGRREPEPGPTAGSVNRPGSDDIDPAQVAFGMPSASPTPNGGRAPAPSGSKDGPPAAPADGPTRGDRTASNRRDTGEKAPRILPRRNRGGLFSDDGAPSDQRDRTGSYAEERSKPDRGPTRTGPSESTPRDAGAPGSAGGHLFGTGTSGPPAGTPNEEDLPARGRAPSVPSPPPAPDRSSGRPGPGASSAPPSTSPRRNGRTDAPETLPSTGEGGPRLFGGTGDAPTSATGPSLFGNPPPAARPKPAGSGPGATDAGVPSPPDQYSGASPDAYPERAVPSGGDAAGVEPGSGSTHPAPVAGEPDRTEAGLVKRTPKSRGARKAIAGGEQAPSQGVGATQRSASEVRTMLSALRSSKDRVAASTAEHGDDVSPSDDTSDAPEPLPGEDRRADDLAAATANGSDAGDPARSRAGDTGPSHSEDT